MTKQEAKKRIEKLKVKINEMSYQYHVLDQPGFDDAVWDSLKHELKQLEEFYPGLVAPDSPTQRVSGQALDKFEKHRHKIRMLSLNDVFDFEELVKWEDRIKKLLPAKVRLDYFAEVKLDGLAVALIYEHGLFSTGATRGDGMVGENVTQNLKTISAIPLRLRLPGSSGSSLHQRGTPDTAFGNIPQLKELEIRGEVYIKKKDFIRLNQEQAKKGEPLFANPRNTAAGAIRQLDPQVAASKKLSFYCYDVVTDVGQKTHAASHNLAGEFGLPVTPYAQLCSDLKAVEGFYRKIEKIRNKLPYHIDGIVVNVNNLDFFNRLGVVGKAPRGAVAYKFAAEKATTQVMDIQLQVGRTGALTPVAIMQPVQVAGTTVSRATLHNEDEIKRLDVRIGDTVVIQKAGDIIPDIVEVLKDLRTGQEKKFHFPKKFMGSSVVRQAGAAAHYVQDKHSNTIHRRQLYHFVSRKAFDIEGLGPKIIDQLMTEGLVKDAADIFTLSPGDLSPLERFAEKSAENLVLAIERAKEIELARFIYALGIRHIGEESAALVAEETSNPSPVKRSGAGQKPETINQKNFVKYFQSFSQKELEELEDIGPIVAESIYDYFHERKNIKLIKKLFKNGVRIKAKKLQAPSSKLSGQIFVLTGQLNSLSREEAKAGIKQLGGKVSANVSKNTDYVVAGSDPGSKYDKAEKLGVKIIAEKEFLELLA